MPTVAQIENADPLIASEAMRLLAAIRASAIYRENRAMYPDVEGKVKIEIERRKAVTGATNASPIVVTAIGHGFSDGDLVTVDGVLGNTAANGPWQVVNPAADTLALFGSTGNTAYTSGGFIIGLVSQHLAAIVAALDEVGDGTVGVKGGRQGVDYSQTRDRESLIAEALDAMYSVTDGGAIVAVGQRGTSNILSCGCVNHCSCWTIGTYAGFY